MKKLAIFAICLIVCLGVGTTAADEITYAGSATATFSASGTAVTGPVSYSAGTFSGTTAFGFGSLNTLGSIHVNTNLTFVSSQTLNLVVTFTLPVGISSGNPVSVAVPVLISVNHTRGLVHLFGSCCTSFYFANGSETGSFTIGINSVDIRPGQTQNITGFLYGESNPTVPEPASVALLGTGFLGLGSFVRRRLHV